MSDSEFSHVELLLWESASTLPLFQDDLDRATVGMGKFQEIQPSGQITHINGFSVFNELALFHRLANRIA